MAKHASLPRFIGALLPCFTKGESNYSGRELSGVVVHSEIPPVVCQGCFAAVLRVGEASAAMPALTG